MSVRSATNEELRQMHLEVLLGILNDFLSWGCDAQSDLASRALAEVTSRVEERKKRVKPNDKILAVI